MLDRTLVLTQTIAFSGGKFTRLVKNDRPKSELYKETSLENKRGDTGLSNGTSPTWKLLRSKENDGFENQHVNQNLCFIALLSSC